MHRIFIFLKLLFKLELIFKWRRERGMIGSTQRPLFFYIASIKNINRSKEISIYTSNSIKQPLKTCAVFTVWKMSKHRVFSGPYFPEFWPEETPYLDTFDTVFFIEIVLTHQWKYKNYAMCSLIANKKKTKFEKIYQMIWVCFI